MSHYSDRVIADGGANLMAYWPLDAEWQTANAAPLPFLFAHSDPAWPGIRPNNFGVGSPLGTVDGPGELGGTEFDGLDSHVATGLANRTNLVTNPSGETNTTGWAGQAGTLTRDVAKGNTGTCSFKIVSTTGANTTRLETSTHPAVTAGKPYTLGARIVGKATEDIRAEIVWRTGAADLTPTTTKTAPYTTAADGFQLIHVTGYAPQTAVAAKLRLYTLASVGTTSDPGWVDSILFEQNCLFESYFDGDSTQSAWTGTAHASTSKWGPFVNGEIRTFEWFAYQYSQDAFQSIFGTDNGIVSGLATMSIGADGSVDFIPSSGGADYGHWGTVVWPVRRWAHAMLVFDEPANSATLYIDGVSQGARTINTQYDAAVAYMQIGCKGSAPLTQAGANPFHGRLAHVAVYDGNRSAFAEEHAVLGLSELTSREPPGPWYSAG